MAVAALMGVGTAVKGEEVPSLDLNFDGQLSSYRRTSTSPTAPKANGDQLATSIVSQNKTGLVQSKYMGPHGKLINGYVTNHISHSTDFSTSYYTHTNSPSLTTGQADPFGGTSATTISDGNSGSFAQVRFTSYPSTITEGSFSLFVRKETTAAHNSMLRFWFGTGEYYDHFFNAASGATDTTEGGANTINDPDRFAVGAIEDLGDWWRVSVSVVTTNTAIVPDVYIYPAVSTGSFPSGYNSATTGAITVFGAQFELTATPSQYVSSTASPAQVPRVEFDANGNPLGLLVEEARTNLLTKSADLTHSDWSAYNSVGVTGGQADPAGGTGAFLVEDKQTTFAHLRQDVSATAYSTYTASIFVKKTAAAASELLLRFKGLGETNADVRLDTYTGQIAGGSDIDVQDCNGWWRISTTTTLGSATQLLFVVYPAISASFNGGDAATAQTTAGTHIVYGPQVELGEGSTSYIPTDTTTLTRPADDITLSTSSFGYLSSTGTSAIDVTVASKTEGNSYPNIFQFRGATDNDRIFLRSNQAAANGGIVDTQHRDGGTATNTSVLSAPLTWPYTLNFAMAHEGTGLRKALGGTLQSQITLNQAPSNPHSTLALGISPSNSARVINGHIRRFTYWPRAINDAQLSKFTNQ